MRHLISIVTVNYNSYDFLQLLAESLREYASLDYELIVVDNSTNPQELDPILYGPTQQLILGHNLGHGTGLNIGASRSWTRYTMFVDVDCHFTRAGWEEECLGQMTVRDIVAGKGVEVKPIRPAFMFMKTEIAKKYDWKATPGYQGHRVTPDGFDVGISAYHQMLLDNVKIQLVEPEPKPNRYGTLNGEEWSIYGGRPFLYHHWHGTHLKERSVDFPDKDLFSDKERMFKQIPWRYPSTPL